MKVVIAGGTSGIGFATAKMLAENNIEVIITGRSEEKLKAALSQLPPTAKGSCVDSSDENALKAFMETTGNIDHLLLALSGAKGGGLFKDLDISLLRAGFEEKLFPQLQTLKAALPHLVSGGSVCFISAVSAHARVPGVAGLAAINAAVEAVVPILAKELKPTRVNAVSPGVIDTPWWNFLPEEIKIATFNQYAEASPVGRIGHVDDIAKVIVQLITNTFITGQVITVDGGMSL
jgi:NAD(P)-dependent dehydrogenase (short-subunit alcohol dehydrogenase family)